MPKYRIIYVDHEGDPCHWQLQERVYLFFWKNLFSNVRKAEVAANVMVNLLDG